jgi:effector-binding domain-containing protein
MIMLTLPEIVDRPAQPYVFVRFTVWMNEMQKPANEGFPKLFGHLQKLGIEPVGPAFYNYRRIDMAGTLDVEAGIAVASAGEDDGDVHFGTLPAGEFVTLTWNGHPDQLMTVTGMLIGWLKETGAKLDVDENADGDHFACRLELYESDPVEVPDMDQWVTTLAFKLAE